MMISDQGITLLIPSECKSLWTDSDQVTCCRVSEDKHGAYSLFELTVPPQGGPPAHKHHWEQEAYYVLEGELLIQKGDRTFKATTGSFVEISKGILYTFKNVGSAPARLLVIVSPARYGKYFEEWATQRRRNTLRHRLVRKRWKS
jgi:mannose-6-phosphate isomerase-like protein (cupin superfamily)